MLKVTRRSKVMKLCSSCWCMERSPYNWDFTSQTVTVHVCMVELLICNPNCSSACNCLMQPLQPDAGRSVPEILYFLWEMTFWDILKEGWKINKSHPAETKAQISLIVLGPWTQVKVLRSMCRYWHSRPAAVTVVMQLKANIFSV